MGTPILVRISESLVQMEFHCDIAIFANGLVRRIFLKEFQEALMGAFVPVSRLDVDPGNHSILGIAEALFDLTRNALVHFLVRV
jgi:hypothetical protein